MAEQNIPAFIRPLSIPELEFSSPEVKTGKLNAFILKILDHLFYKKRMTRSEINILELMEFILLKVPDPIKTLQKRYKDFSNNVEETLLSPEHPDIIKNFIRPLLEAKQCYILKMPIASISLSGFVGEMVANWRWEMLDPKIKSQTLDKKTQELLSGRKFENLEQAKKIKVLKTLEHLDKETANSFNRLKDIRNNNLHIKTKPPKGLDKDAQEAYKHGCFLFSKTLNIQCVEGRLFLPQKVSKYINEIIQDKEFDN